jgi:hypothetical protein
MSNGRRAHISTLFAGPQGCIEVHHQFKRISEPEQFLKEECCVLNNNNFWMYLFLMCRVLYASMCVLRLADQQTASMDKLYFYVLQTDGMLIKWLPDYQKKSSELLRDSSLGQVMTNCGTDIDWGSNKGEIVDDEDSDEGSDDDDSSLEIDEKGDIKDAATEFDFSCPVQVSFCACDSQLLPLNLLNAFLVGTKVTLICLSTREMD